MGSWTNISVDGFTGQCRLSPPSVSVALAERARSNQEVTLTTSEPHTRLRILGITSDHGLLRCLPLDAQSAKGPSGLTPLYSRGDFGGEDDRIIGSGGAGARNRKTEYVDLQPDGNSFDLMAGLIKRKQ